MADKKLNRGDVVWFIGYYTHEVIKAEVTGRIGNVATLKGLSENHENERFDRHTDELFMTREAADKARKSLPDSKERGNL